MIQDPKKDHKKAYRLLDRLLDNEFKIKAYKALR